MTPTQKGVQPTHIFNILSSMGDKGFLTTDFFKTLKEWGQLFKLNQWQEARTKETGKLRAYFMIMDLPNAREIASQWIDGDEQYHDLVRDTAAGHRLRLAVTLATGIRTRGFIFSDEEPITDIKELIEIIETRFGENATKEGAQTNLERKTEGNPPKEVIEGSYRIIS